MSRSSEIPGLPFRHIGVAAPARSRAFRGSGARLGVDKIGEGLGASLRASLTVAFLVGLAATFAISAAPALAAHVFSGSFGGPCTGAGGACEPDQLKEPAGIAVNEETGDVYVVDKKGNRVVEFNSTGSTQLAEFNGAAAPTGPLSSPEEIAVDNSDNPLDPSRGDVYVTDLGAGAVYKFSAAGVYEGQFAEHSLVNETYYELLGVAVDPAGGVFVYRRGGGGRPEVEAYNDAASNEFISEEEFPSAYNDTGAYRGFAVGAEGDLYVANEATNTFSKRDAFKEVLIEEMDKERSTGAAADSAKNDVYIDNATSIAEFNSAPTCTAENPCETAPASALVERFGEGRLTAGSGIAVNSASFTKTVYVADSSTDTVSIFLGSIVPVVTTGEETTPVEGSATLNGTVNPHGIALKSCEFEYVAEGPFAEATVAEEEALKLAGEANERAAAARARAGKFQTEGRKERVEEEEAEAVAEEARARPQEARAREQKEGFAKALLAECTDPDVAEIGSGTAEVAVHADVAGLTPGAVYHYRLVGTNREGEETGHALTFVALGRPVSSGETVTSLSTGGVTLSAQVNPEGLDTTYRFEYDTRAYGPGEAAHGTSVPVPPADIGGGTSDVAVSQRIEGLSANVTYYWRIVAENKFGASAGLDHVFVYDTEGAPLPDHRAYELVTPPFKNGARIGKTILGLPTSIAENGSRVIEEGVQCFASSQACTVERGTVGNEFEFSRTPGGWQATALAPPATEFSANTPLSVDASAGMAIFSMPDTPSRTEDFYVRQPDGSFLEIGPSTFPEDDATSLGAGGIESGTIWHSADFSHLVWEDAHGGLTWPFDRTSPLYEYVGAGDSESEPFAVSVTGGQESTELIPGCSASMGGELGNSKNSWNALATDGRTVYFTCIGEGLYARVDGETSEAHTVAISQPRAPATLASTAPDEDCTTKECEEDIADPADWRDAEFEGASRDGSHAFFLDTQKLTDQATQGAGSVKGLGGCEASGTDCNLYLYDFDEPAGHNLIDASAPETGDETPRVQGVVASSADGSHVYFVANGVLAPGASPGDCSSAGGNGTCNLYVYERDARYPQGHIALIASVPGTDGENWVQGNSSANVTPDGRFLVFASHGDLTPDDTRTDGSTQVFRYDADPTPVEEAAHVPQLIRVSVGEHGFDDDGNAGAGEAIIVGGQAQPRGDPTMSNDGSYVFFQSPVGLTPQALNDVQLAANNGSGQPTYANNVYEWELAGTPGGTCSADAPGGGCVYLITDGRDTGLQSDGSDVRLLGSDETGHDVFFTTVDQLVPQDTDTQLDIYDARVCEPENGNPCISEPPPALPPCLGEACHGIAPAPPSLLSPGTATFNGEGNVAPTAASSPAVKPKALTSAQRLADALKACAKKPKKKRAACERQARKRYGAAKAKQSARAKKSTREEGSGSHA